MERKTLSKKWKIIICCVVLILAMTGTGITVWAIARNYFRYNADFNVNITGSRYVNATIKGESYIAGTTEAYETLTTASFNGSRESEESTLSFTKPITIQNDEQVSKLRFEITNNSPYTTHSDLIIKPSITTKDIDDVIITWYYSTNNISYYVYTNDYLVSHKGDTLYLELRMLAAVNLFGETSLSDAVSIDLYSEMNTPADFAYEYVYAYNSKTSTATKAKVCPTCEHTENAVAMEEGEYFLLEESEISSDISNKVVFYKSSSEESVKITGGLSNVIFVNGLFSPLTIEITNSEEISTKYNNITFINTKFYDSIKVTPASDYNGALADFSLLSNIKFYNCNFSQDIIEYTSFDVSIDNLLIKGCTIGSDAIEGESTVYTLKNINNLIFKNNASKYGGLEFIFENVNNAIVADMYVPPLTLTLKNTSGDIYLVNNALLTSLQLFGTTTNANIYIKNNDSDISTIATISAVENTVIEAYDNSGSGADISLYKFNLGDSSSTITIGNN